jgi:hypothetical protein
MKQLLLAAILLPLSAVSQDIETKTLQKERESSEKNFHKDASDTSNKIWKKGGVFTLNLSQSALSNWAAGGDDYSIALNGTFIGYINYKKGHNSWDNTLRLNLGYVNTSSLGPRKNDDRIDFLSKYGHEINEKWSWSTVFNFRSQFFKGYEYPKDGTTPILSSDFLAPAYILLGLGADYKPAKELSIFISPLSARWVIVRDDTLSAKGAYGVTPGSTSLFQLGAFSTISYKVALNKTVGYTGRLDLFSDYLHHPQNIAINMTNLFAVKISNLLAVTYSLDLIYDDNVRLFGPNHDAPRLQVKSIIGAGLLVRL